MMSLTVGQLKEKLKNFNDSDTICIERVQDVYFEKHKWATERVVYSKVDGIDYDYSDYFDAFSVVKDNDKCIIVAHY